MVVETATRKYFGSSDAGALRFETVSSDFSDLIEQKSPESRPVVQRWETWYQGWAKNASRCEFVGSSGVHWIELVQR